MIKIFYKKDYYETKQLLNYESQKRHEEQELYKERIINLTMNYENQIEELNIKLLQVKGSNGGLTTKIKNLEKEIERIKETNDKLNKELSELKSSSYLIKKVKSGRTPNTQKMRLHKGASNLSNVRKYIKNELER